MPVVLFPNDSKSWAGSVEGSFYFRAVLIRVKGQTGLRVEAGALQPAFSSSTTSWAARFSSSRLFVSVKAFNFFLVPSSRYGQLVMTSLHMIRVGVVEDGTATS